MGYRLPERLAARGSFRALGDQAGRREKRGPHFVPAAAARTATAVVRGMRGGRRTGEEKGRFLVE